MGQIKSEVLLSLVVVVFACLCQNVAAAESESKVVCFGETLKLRCEVGKLEIYGAYYRVLRANSTLCGHPNPKSTPCHQPSLEILIRKDCHGKADCLLSYNNQNGSQQDCRSSMYLNVLYGCVVPTSEPGSNLYVPPDTTEKPLLETSTHVTPINDKSTSDNAFWVTRLLVQFKLIARYCQENVGKMLLAILVSVAAGILLLILISICSMCCKKYKKQTGKFDVEDGKEVEVSAPVVPTNVPTTYETVLVTRQNGVPLSEQTISSDSTLTTTLTRGKSKHKEHQVISTIRRTHSIDEGTQTDIEDDDKEDEQHQPRTLSVVEQQELGYLVDSMNFYNRRLDDDSYYPQLKNNTSSKASERSVTPEQLAFYYSNPDRKPLLTQSSTEAYSNLDDSSSEERNLKIPQSRNQSELSYTTSGSTQSLDLYDAVMNGSEHMRYNSMQRTTPRPPQTPKLGVRGDGFDFIQ